MLVVFLRSMPANYDAGTFEQCTGDSGEVMTSIYISQRIFRLVLTLILSPWVSTEVRLSSKAMEILLPLIIYPVHLPARQPPPSAMVLSSRDPSYNSAAHLLPLVSILCSHQIYRV